MERFPGHPTADEEEAKVRAFVERRTGAAPSQPRVPDMVHGNAFVMRNHQLESLRAWGANGHNGILELATGAGKTITAIYAATRIAESRGCRARSRGSLPGSC